MVVILFLWLFWRQPQQSSSEAFNSVSQTKVATSTVRPEPIVPTAAADTSDTPLAQLVPDVLGDPQNSAVRALEAAGYSVNLSKVHATSKASGIVIGQTPAGGAPLESGSSVSLVVSSGDQAALDVTMPEIVGLSQASAEAKVKSAGLVPYITYGSSGVPQGQVISQWPLAGEVLPAGSEGFIQIQLNP
jgi:serine/threonine-protein kinase